MNCQGGKHSQIVQARTSRGREPVCRECGEILGERR